MLISLQKAMNEIESNLFYKLQPRGNFATKSHVQIYVSQYQRLLPKQKMKGNTFVDFCLVNAAEQLIGASTESIEINCLVFS